MPKNEKRILYKYALKYTGPQAELKKSLKYRMENDGQDERGALRGLMEYEPENFTNERDVFFEILEEWLLKNKKKLRDNNERENIFMSFSSFQLQKDLYAVSEWLDSACNRAFFVVDTTEGGAE